MNSVIKILFFVLVSMIFNTIYAQPPSNRGMYFDGVDDYVQTSLAPSANTTLELWFKCRAFTGSGQPLVSSLQAQGSGENGYSIEITKTNTLRFSIGNNGARFVFIESPKSIELNQWTHVAASWNGTNAILYINGVNVKDTIPTSKSAIYGTLPYTFGVHAFKGANYFNGLIDDVKIFSTVRTLAQIKTDMTDQTATANGLISYWNFEDNANGVNAPNVKDIRGTNTGTPTNGPLWALRVTDNTDDATAGLGSLRQAITEANKDTDTDYIDFSIQQTDATVSGGTSTITQTSQFPDISQPVLLDGYSAYGTSRNTNAFGLGSNAQIRVVISGFAGTSTLNVTSTGSTIRGLSITGGATGITLNGSNNTLVGSFVGLLPNGTLGSISNVGLMVAGTNNLIGTLVNPASFADLNILSGGVNKSVVFTNATNATLRNNYVNTNVSGSSKLGASEGVWVQYTNKFVLIESNVITSNGTSSTAVSVNSVGTAGSGNSSKTIIRSNYIGIGADRKTILSNTNGVSIDNLSDSSVIEKNIIVNNNTAINISATAKSNFINQNNIYCNTIKGININTTGNVGKVAPIISSATPTLISGTCNAGDVIEVFRDSVSCGVVNQGKHYLGKGTVLGTSWTFSGTFLIGQKITATATNITNGTSEFSSIATVANPLPTQPTGNRGMYFDGTTTVSIPNHGCPTGSSARTIEAWIKTKSKNMQAIFGYGNGSGLRSQIQFRFNSSVFQIELGNVTPVFTYNTPDVTDNKWHHIAWSYPGSGALNTSSLYIDGVKITSFTGGTYIPNTTVPESAYIGSVLSTFYNFTGQIDEVKVWKTARTQQEVQTDMSSVVSDPNLVGYWNLDQSTGQVVNDASGNATNGNLGSTNGIDLNDPLWALRVTDNTDDATAGLGSLRQAIAEANLDTDTDYIDFSIQQEGTTSIIQPTTTLNITNPVVLDGFSAYGSTPNTAPYLSTNNANLKLEIDMQYNVTGADGNNGFTLNTSNSIIKGLAIYNTKFNTNTVGPIRIVTGGSNTIEGNWIGFKTDGTAVGNMNGVIVDGAGTGNNVIGWNGTVKPAASNLITSNSYNPVILYAGTANGNFIQGNYLSVDKTGLAKATNSFVGIVLRSENNTVLKNIIGYTRDYGIKQPNGTKNFIYENRIFCNGKTGIDSALTVVFRPTLSGSIDGATVTLTVDSMDAVGTKVIYFYKNTSCGKNQGETLARVDSLVANGVSKFTYSGSGFALGDVVTVRYVSSNGSSIFSDSLQLKALVPKLGAALDFDGTNDYVSVPDNNSLDLTNNFTISAWVKTNSIATKQRVVDKRSATAGSGGYSFGIEVGGKLIFTSYNVADITTPTAHVSANTWTHLAVTYQNQTNGLNFYVNGNLVYTTNGVGVIPANIYPLRISGESSGIALWNGQLDEVRIWQRVLTGCEIKGYMNCDHLLDKTGLSAQYSFNQGLSENANPTIITVRDSSINANNGTLNGFALTGNTSNWVEPGGVISGTSCEGVDINVSNLNDNGAGSLRQAILDINAGICNSYVLNLNVSGTIILASSLPAITKELTINGNGVTVSGNKLYSIFAVNNAKVAFNNLVIIDGLAKGGDGLQPSTHGGGGGGGAGLGAAIFVIGSSSDVTLTDVVFKNNKAFGGNGGAGKFTTGVGSPNIGGNGGQASRLEFSGPVGAGSTSSNGSNGGVFSGGGGSANLVNGAGGKGGIFAGGGGAGVPLSGSGTTTCPPAFGEGGFLGGNGGTSCGGSNASGGGGGAGLGGAVFVYEGKLTIQNVHFENNKAVGGIGGRNYPFIGAASDGMGKGGALFVNSGATLVTFGSNTFLSDSATDGLCLPLDNNTYYNANTNGLNLIDFPEIDILGNNVSIANGDLIPTFVDSTDFGFAKSKLFTIKNTGTNVLNVSSISLAVGTNFKVSPTSLTIPVNSSATFKVDFNYVSGSFSDTLKILNNDCDESVYKFAVRGNLQGEALDFDGVDDIAAVSNGSAMLANKTSITMEGWAKIAGAGIQGLFGIRASNDAAPAFWIASLGGPYIEYRTSTNEGVKGYTFTLSNNVNGWHHYALVYDGSYTYFYLDGHLIQKQPLTGVITNASLPFYMGYNEFIPTSKYYLKGQLDEVRVWNRALCQAEIQNNMGVTKLSDKTGLLAQYSFNQGVASGVNTSITSVVDSVGINHGTLTGFAKTLTASNFIAPGAVRSDSVAGVVVCPFPATNKVCVQPTNSEVHISWNSVVGATNGYKVIYTNVLADTVKTPATVKNMLVKGTDTTITNLTNDTFYYFAVVTVGGDTSSWMAAVPVVQSGKAVSLDGTSQFVTLKSVPSANHLKSNFTVEAWVKSTDVRTGEHVIVSNRREGSDGHFFTIFLVDGKLGVEVNGTVDRTGLGGNTLVADNLWHHVALVRRDTAFRLYLDGKLEAKNNSLDTIDVSGSKQELYVGARFRNDINVFGGYLLGEIDEVRIWNTDKSQAELNEYKDKPLIGSESGLVGLYHFDEPSGGIVYDATCNAYNGVKINSPAIVQSKAMQPFKFDTLSAKAQKGGINISWKSNIAIDVEYVKIFKLPSVSADTSLADTSFIAAFADKSFVDSLVSSCNTYFYKIAGVDSLGQVGAVSDVDSAKYCLKASVVTAATNTTTNSFTAIWSKGDIEEKYVLQVATDTNFKFIVKEVVATDSTVSVQNLSENQILYFRVVSILGKDSSFSNIKMISTYKLPGSGNALPLDGATQYVDLGSGFKDLSSGFTVAMWVKPELNSTDDKYLFLSDGEENFSLQKVGKSDLQFKIANSDATELDLNAANVLMDNEWQHIAVSIDPLQDNKALLFVNGIVVDSTSMTNMLQNKVRTKNYLGNDDFNNYYNGQLDETSIWSKGLSTAEIRSLMCKKLKGSEDGLLFYSRFDEPSGIFAENKALKASSDARLIASPQRVLSGAALGDTSVYVYNAQSLKFKPVGSDSVTLDLVKGTAKGLHIFKVNEAANNLNKRLGVDSLEKSNYIGTFVVGGVKPTLSMNWGYAKNTNDAIAKDSLLTVMQRNHNASGPFGYLDSVSTNKLSKTILAYGDSTRKEYVIAYRSIPDLTFESKKDTVTFGKDPLIIKAVATVVGKIVYTISDTNIALIINDSIIVPRKNGTVTITATMIVNGVKLVSVKSLRVVVPNYTILGKKFVNNLTQEKYSISPMDTSLTYSWLNTDSNTVFLSGKTGENVDLLFLKNAQNSKLYCKITNSLYEKYSIEIYKSLTVEEEVNTTPNVSCDSIVNNSFSCKGNYIEGIELSELNRTNSGCSDGGYEDLTSVSKYNATLYSGMNYNIKFKIGYNPNFIKSVNYVGAWIDYNNNGSFDEKGEFLVSDFSTDSVVELKNILISTNVSDEGEHRLRVKVRSSGVFTDASSCVNFQESGETEDYKIVIKIPESLEIPVLISPDGDGKNDMFVIKGINLRGDVSKLTILDKQGNAVYSNDNYDNTWKGVDNSGELLPRDTYYYYYMNGKTVYKGFFEIRY